MRKIFPFYLHLFSQYLLIIYRRLIFLFKRQNTEDSFLYISKDNSFSNSIITIDFYFPDLIYLYLPQIGKKLYNGTIEIAADKIKHPYNIEVVTTSGKIIYEIPFDEYENFFNISTISLLRTHAKELNWNNKPNFPKPRLNSLNPKSKIQNATIKHFSFTIPNKHTDNNIFHKTFNTEDYL